MSDTPAKSPLIEALDQLATVKAVASAAKDAEEAIRPKAFALASERFAEEGTDRWVRDGATITLTKSEAGAKVVDPDLFAPWVRENHPDLCLRKLEPSAGLLGQLAAQLDRDVKPIFDDIAARPGEYPEEVILQSLRAADVNVLDVLGLAIRALPITIVPAEDALARLLDAGLITRAGERYVSVAYGPDDEASIDGEVVPGVEWKPAKAQTLQVRPGKPAKVAAAARVMDPELADIVAAAGSADPELAAAREQGREVQALT